MTTTTDDKSVQAIVSLSRVLADKDTNIVSLQKTLAIARDDCERLSKVCDEYRAERDEYKEKLIDANMMLQSQQARPLADVEEDLSSVKDQLAEVSRQKDELLLSVIANPKSFVEAIEYLDSALRFDLHTKITAIGNIKKIIGLSLANAVNIVHDYVARREWAEENGWPQKEECKGCGGGCCSERVELVIPDEGERAPSEDTEEKVGVCTMGCHDCTDTTAPSIPVDLEGTKDANWHLEDDEIPF